jgi:glycosyltransferase involved in cell wall biosynthesis
MSSSEKKIFHIISSLRRGGRERQLATIYKYSKNSDNPCKIICFNKSSDSYVDEFNILNDILYLNSKNPVKRYFEIRKLLKPGKTELIWTWGGFEASFGLVLSLLTGVKHINGSIRHGIVRFNRNQLWRMLVLQLSKNRVANSHAGLKANYLKTGFVLYNGIDERFFEPSIIPPDFLLDKLNIIKNRFVFISIANLVPYKDYKTIIEALNLLNQHFTDFHYLIVGEGPERKNIECLIQKNNLQDNITILGRRTDIKDLLNASDVFIHSSRGEGCSNAILEAMSCGLPVIATDTGGTSEIIQDDFGYLFPFKDVNSLYSIMKSLIENKTGLENMGKASKIFAKNNFSVQKMMTEYKKIITTVLNKN